MPVENALVFVDRQYIPENVFKTVELPKTDANGQTVLHLVRNDVIYNLRIIKENIVLGTFDNIVAFCQDFTIGDCTIDLNAFDSTEEIFSYDNFTEIQFTTPSYNETSGIVTFNFATNDGSVKNVTMFVERNDIFGNRTICTNELFSASGSLSCAAGTGLDETTLVINIFVDNSKIISSPLNISGNGLGEIGYLAFFMILLSFVIMFSDPNQE